MTFEQISPDIPELSVPGESAAGMAQRLAVEKATSVAGKLKANLKKDAPWIVIGSDQVCEFNGEKLGKPGDAATAASQLARFSSQWINFSTGLCLVNSDGTIKSGIETYRCHFRPLTEDVITRYLRLDQPFDCAGAIKFESAGAALIQDTQGRDINSLYGLPVMLLTDLLEALGFSIFDFIKKS